jgi:putative PEP-CTERM system TPR-repeat lipoprotein
VEAALALAQVDAAEGKLNDAIARARRAASDHPNLVLAQRVLARLELDAGKTDEALNAARRAREINPRDPSAVELLGLTQMAAGDTAGAVLSFTTLVNMRPRYVPGRMRLVETLRSSGDRRTALAAARALLVVAPGNADALTALGTLLLEDKRYDEALAVAGEAKSKHPKRALGHAMEGEIRMAQSDPTAALAAFRRADELDPSGRLRIRMHQAESAWLGHDAPVGPLLDWIKQSPDDIGVRVYCADTLVRLSRTGEAIPLYLEALEKAPQDFRLLNNIADALMRQGEPKALDYAHQAFQLRPSDPIVAATLGTALLRSGKIYEAVQLLQKATQMAPEHAEIHYQFVLALSKAGDRVRAKAELQRLLEGGKAFPQRTEAQVLVKQL